MNTDSLMSGLKTHGVDTDGIADRFHNDNEFYMACLRKFLANQSFEALGQAISSRDYAAAFYIAHGLKGVSGNLGLDPIFQAAGTMTDHLRAKKYGELDLQYSAIMSCLSELKALVQD